MSPYLHGIKVHLTVTHEVATFYRVLQNRELCYGSTVFTVYIPPVIGLSLNLAISEMPLIIYFYLFFRKPDLFINNIFLEFPAP